MVCSHMVTNELSALDLFICIFARVCCTEYVIYVLCSDWTAVFCPGNLNNLNDMS